MKNLFVYYIRKRLPVVLVATLVFAILTIIFLSQSSFIRYYREDNVIKTSAGDNPFIYLSVLISTVSTVIPVMEFYFKMKRRSVDLFYSLPISRVKLYAVKYLLGLVEVFIICIPQWAISFIWVASVENVFQMEYYLVYGACAIAFVAIIYSFMTFFFTMANSLVDGVIFMAMASCILALIMNCVRLFVGLFYGDMETEILKMRYYFIYSPFFDSSMNIYYLMSGTNQKLNIPGLCSVIFLGISSVVLFFLFSSFKNNAEVISDDSDSWFGYRVMIPAYMVTSFTLAGKFSPLWVIVAITGYVAYAIYCKNFKIKKNDLFAYVISVVIGLILASFL